MKHLKTFVPNSACANEFPEITLKGIERFPYALDELGQYGTEIIRNIEVEEINSENKLNNQFKDLFEYHRPDKHMHGYHHNYGQIFSLLGISTSLNILEIGIGTNNDGLISNMGKNGKPGASLRAFRDIAINSEVFGADID